MKNFEFYLERAIAEREMVSEDSQALLNNFIFGGKLIENIESLLNSKKMTWIEILKYIKDSIFSKDAFGAYRSFQGKASDIAENLEKQTKGRAATPNLLNRLKEFLEKSNPDFNDFKEEFKND